MGESISKNLVFIIILLLNVPLTFGIISDSLSKGTTKVYTIGQDNFEINCYNGNSDSQIADYKINGELHGLMQGWTWSLPNGYMIRNLGFSGGSCQFSLGLATDPAMCNECVNQNEKWCEDTYLILSCRPVGTNNCLKIVNYDHCDSPYMCSNGGCVLPSGCSNNNPPCNSGYQCVNNQCVKQCNEGNICEGNYVYYQKADCSKQSIKFCQWGCSNGDCAGAPPGCTYNNPACLSNYNCVNNQCVIQNPTGCAYNNPPCSSGYTCINNQCVQNQQACNPECNNLLQQWCNGNVVMVCYKVNNCPKILQMEVCTGDKSCVNGQCVVQQKLGCAYHNPDCSFGYECINNACVKKQPVVTCEQGLKCKDDFNKGYQNADCSLSSVSYCQYGCKWGHCLESPSQAKKVSQYPILLIHGHSFISGTTKTGENIDIMKPLLDQFFYDYGIFYGVQAILSKANERDYPKRWCEETNEKLKNNGKTQRVVTFSYYFGDTPLDKLEEGRSISEYRDDLNNAINLVYQCTNSKVIIIAYSMGGLVARDYLSEYGDSKVSHLIMLGTPNKGTISSFVCNLLHPGSECQEMQSTSTLIDRLNKTKPNSVIYVTLAGEYNGMNNDGIVSSQSVLLDNSHQYIVNCHHKDLYNPIKCPDAYKYIKQVLADDYSQEIKNFESTNKINQIPTEDKLVQEQSVNPQSRNVQQTPTITSSSNTQQSTQKPQEQQIARTEVSTPQTKPQTEEPKQPEPQQQEQKREEPKTLASAIKTWFSKWFG